MKKFLFSILGIASTVISIAQVPTGAASSIQQAPLLESTTEATLQGPLWNVVIENQEAEKDMYPSGSNILQIKAMLAQQRDANKNLLPTTNTSKKTRALPPTKGVNFKGNQLHSLVPTDNSMAVSKDGRIVSADNWNLLYTDVNGTIIKDSIVWNDFLNYNVNFQNGKYDPRVIYDNVHDRFIVVILCAPADVVKNKIAIAFSKTNNPMNGWNIYGLGGNPLSDSSWADYPNIGINNNELFINVNLFKGQPTYAYNQSVIYQINMANGYGAGAMLDYKVWASNIQTLDGKPGFTIVPASDGMGQASTSKNMWFVSNWPDGDNGVNAFQITEDIYGSSAQLLSYRYSVPTFSVCANGFIYDAPTGYKDSINTGSSVVQNAYIIDSVLHYTFDANVGTGWCGVQYGRIDLRAQTATTKAFGNSGTLLCYPAIASFGHTAKDKSAVICYLQADTSLYPQVCAVAVDDAMNFSTPIVLKKGDTTINMLYPPAQNNIAERWGDYTGIQRKYNTAMPEVWCAGAYAGNNSRKASYNTWMTQLLNGNAALPIAPITKSATNASVYPNPSYQEFNYTWQQATEQNVHIYIINISGQIIKEIFNGDMEKGQHTIRFNKGAMASGQYFLMMDAAATSEKIRIVVQ
jgi:Secretion system C-terminal sorting domain